MELDIFLMPLNPIQENNLTARALVGIFIATEVLKYLVSGEKVEIGRSFGRV